MPSVSQFVIASDWLGAQPEITLAHNLGFNVTQRGILGEHCQELDGKPQCGLISQVVVYVSCLSLRWPQELSNPDSALGRTLRPCLQERHSHWLLHLRYRLAGSYQTYTDNERAASNTAATRPAFYGVCSAC